MNSLKNIFKKTKKIDVLELFIGFNKSMKNNIEAMHILRDTVKDIYDSREWDCLKNDDRNKHR